VTPIDAVAFTPMARTAFVTGGTGFLGRHVVEQLTHQGWHVTALHRESSDTRHVRALGATLALGSITDPESLARGMPADIDAAFHVAGNTSFWIGDRSQQTTENVDGTRLMVQVALAKRAKCFVHTSSDAAWGPPAESPFDETTRQRGQASWINYERTKHLAELEVEKGVQRGLRAVILCPGNVIGKYDANQWGRVIRMVYAGTLPGVPPGGATWAAAAEVARAHVVAVDRGRSQERYLLGGDDATFLQMVQMIGELLGKKVPSRPLPAWLLKTAARVSNWGSLLTRRAPDITPEIAEITCRRTMRFRCNKAIRELDFRPVPLQDALAECVGWMRAEGMLESSPALA
jgi:dihydroflavonol-4-reductase